MRETTVVEEKRYSGCDRLPRNTTAGVRTRLLLIDTRIARNRSDGALSKTFVGEHLCLCKKEERILVTYLVPSSPDTGRPWASLRSGVRGQCRVGQVRTDGI